MKPLKSQNFYEVLNVSQYASQEDIRKAYEICKHTFQGDSLATYSLYSDEENQEIFTLITHAYETLRNPNLRRDYDTYLSGGKGIQVQGGTEEDKMAASVYNSKPDFKSNLSSNGGKKTLAASRMPKNEALDGEKTDEKPAENSDDTLEKFLASVKVFNGSTLKKSRHLKGYSLEELADLTKIRITYLKYMEEEDFEFLPAEVYVKGFVIIVCNSLGIPSQKAAKEYISIYREKTASHK